MVAINWPRGFAYACTESVSRFNSLIGKQLLMPKGKIETFHEPMLCSELSTAISVDIGFSKSQNGSVNTRTAQSTWLFVVVFAAAVWHFPTATFTPRFLPSPSVDAPLFWQSAHSNLPPPTSDIGHQRFVARRRPLLTSDSDQELPVQLRVGLCRLVAPPRARDCGLDAGARQTSKDYLNFLTVRRE